MIPLVLFATLSAALLFLCLRAWFVNVRPPLRLPPGPPGHFLSGNLREFKSPQRWKTFARWRETYGGIVHVKVLKRSVIILNDLHSTLEILAKQSAVTAGRPRFVMACELMGFDTATATSQPNEFHRKMRRYMVPALHTRNFSERHPIIADERDNLLDKLEFTPWDFSQHLRRAVASVVLRFAYSHTVAEDHDPLVELINRSLESVSVALSSTYLVEFLPILRYMPEWFPGAAFKAQAREWATIRRESIEAPFLVVRNKMEAGIVEPSFLQRLLEARSPSEDWNSERVQAMKYAAGSLYTAGSDTTVSALSTFVLTMILSPDKQQKAQQELDTVLGPGMAPGFQDRDSLPYMGALVMEVLRWHPVLPLAIAHVATENIVYEDYTIPKGTTLLPNIWSMSRDATMYPNPNEFLPERFLSKSQGGLHDRPAIDPNEFVFGFGRRVCPGKTLATEILWIFAASILANFDILPWVDEVTGLPNLPEGTYGDGTIVHPQSFQCNFKRRHTVV
ncbi:cytochrome P450 family oxidoreductase OrdA, putative [Rhizoctonia solani AG-3 Rhs1AP]|uniref:Cytochrome P450 family oxidoreductase OrdA, putative n=1 Tax=Rhizoctonia solani AG-3 Rhs1AP TaxID=1086054 RepID=X8JQJ6_9AGAM|nr:cytochrome P450 family oxidoreductase OrdA, putative [Rhizoctonia solani AG-3 Rhs1AP]